MAGGGEKKGPLTQPAALTMGLNSARTQESRGSTSFGDSRVSDSSRLTDTAGRSPLDLESRSYAQASEFQEQRQKETRMREQAEKFVGAQTFPGIGDQATPDGTEETPETKSSPSGQRRGRGESEAEGEEETEAEQFNESGELLRQQAQDRMLQEQQKQSQALTQKQAAEKRQAQTVDYLWKWGKAGLGASSITGVGLIALIAILNLQLVNQISINSPMIPRLNIGEILLTVVLDFLLIVFFLFVIYMVYMIIDLIGEMGILENASILFNFPK